MTDILQRLTCHWHAMVDILRGLACHDRHFATFDMSMARNWHVMTDILQRLTCHLHVIGMPWSTFCRAWHVIGMPWSTV